MPDFLLSQQNHMIYKLNQRKLCSRNLHSSWAWIFYLATLQSHAYTGIEITSSSPLMRIAMN